MLDEPSPKLGSSWGLDAVAGTASDIIRHEAAATNRAQRRVGSGCFRWVKGVLFEAMSK